MEMQVEMDFGSERANKVVQQSGWTAPRRIDTHDYQRFFEAENLPALPAAIARLSARLCLLESLPQSRQVGRPLSTFVRNMMQDLGIVQIIWQLRNQTRHRS